MRVCVCFFCVAVKSKKSKKDPIETSLEAIQEYFAKRSEQSSGTESDDVVFGKLVGSELAKLSDDSIKRNLKRKIISDIYDAADEQSKQTSTLQYMMVGADGKLHPVVLPLNEA